MPERFAKEERDKSVALFSPWQFLEVNSAPEYWGRCVAGCRRECVAYAKARFAAPVPSSA